MKPSPGWEHACRECIRECNGHIHHFSKATALAALTDTGCEVIDYCYTRGAIEIPLPGWKANLKKLPKKLLYAIHPDLAVKCLNAFSLLVLTR